jgi:hypothetical protein
MCVCVCVCVCVRRQTEGAGLGVPIHGRSALGWNGWLVLLPTVGKQQLVESQAKVKRIRLYEEAARLLRQYLCVCTSKAERLLRLYLYGWSLVSRRYQISLTLAERLLR